MDENQNKTKTNRRLIAALTVCSLLAGSGTVCAAEASPQTQRGGVEVSQTATITGKVFDKNGNPVIGASVLVKGTNTGGMTDIDGNFSVKAAPGAKLQISYVGFETREVDAKQGMEVTLSDNPELLDEVVVVGYGVQKKVNLTGAVANIDVDEAVGSRPITDVAKALQGVSPGLSVTTNVGGVGVDSNIRLRGTTGSLNAGSGTSPLILVDNVEVPSLSLVNPNDIESISVLKDAASAAIYGTRAAWGVILITTKQGKKNEKPTVKYSNNFAWSTPTMMPQVATS